MFNYDHQQFCDLLGELLRTTVSQTVWNWLREQSAGGDHERIKVAFVIVPRRTGKMMVDADLITTERIKKALPGFSVSGMTIDRVARTWLLCKPDPADQDKYVYMIGELFRSGEMSELAALYGSLAVFAYPGSWVARCSEGIRSNIGMVLESIMYANPYPAKNLDEAAWNQMVLKAIFTGKDIRRIIGLDERSNLRLADALVDYAHERWAAGRTVNPLLWRLVGPFADERIMPELSGAFAQDDELTKKSVLLSLTNNRHPAATSFLTQHAAEKKAIEELGFSWDNLAEAN